jgi:hypothetical protein
VNSSGVSFDRIEWSYRAKNIELDDNSMHFVGYCLVDEFFETGRRGWIIGNGESFNERHFVERVSRRS